jgi:hypothetical protein
MKGFAHKLLVTENRNFYYKIIFPSLLFSFRGFTNINKEFCMDGHKLQLIFGVAQAESRR